MALDVLSCNDLLSDEDIIEQVKTAYTLAKADN